MNRVYLCIDLKTFYASVECVERKLDPFKVDLVVADKEKGTGTICLAISPHMKKRGIKNRCRVFEIPKNVHPIFAKPRMKKYIEYSANIYKIYLKYLSKDDIHVYSIDEAFLDVTSYLNLYKISEIEIAKMIMNDILKTTGITATCGIGTNMYLAKIALDIISKHVNNNIGYLNEKLFKDKLWYHTPLSDFWGIGVKTEARLNKLHLLNMHDIAYANKQKLYKEFGIDAELLIDHSFGKETCTIKDIKNYKSKSNSISNSQILFKDYNYIQARIVLSEMTDSLINTLVEKKCYTDSVGFSIGYSNYVIPSLKASCKISHKTNSYSTILDEVLKEYDYRINKNYMIRRVSVYFSNIDNKRIKQLDIFNTVEIEEKDETLEIALKNIKSKYGNNSILRAISYEDDATAIIRNKLIGGHNAE